MPIGIRNYEVLSKEFRDNILEKFSPSSNIWSAINIDGNLDFQEIMDKEEVSELKDRSGVYWYKLNEESIYIGKAKNLRDRFKSHLKEIKLIHKDCPVYWGFIFNHYLNNRRFCFYFVELENELDRIVLESLLQGYFSDKFIYHQKAFKREMGGVNPRGDLSKLSDLYRDKFNRVLKSET